ncbi:MAG: single-stranded-DNA-specific exonuclease RecJ [Terriglobia bacterium]
MRWVISQTNPDCVRLLTEALGVSSRVAHLLATRGLTDPERAGRFLSPRLDHLHDPLLMRDMPRAVARLSRAIELQEKVLIYGDYDVDGTMAAVVLLAALRAQGARVDVHIPDRFADGYGMRASVIERAAQEGARLIVSVDNGIREHPAFARMKELGIDGIVTDHHLPEALLPDAHAILNPRRPGCEYPEKNLAGAGVAFKLAQALMGARFSEAVLRSYLKLVAIGSIADVVPLTGENRVIAHYGLAGLTQSARSLAASSPGRAGLSALLAVAGLEGKTVSAGDVAFRLAPRLNAAGRMGNARHVIELFSRSAEDGVREVALRLDELNASRQRSEHEIVTAIREQMKLRPELRDRFTLVFAGDGWHRGVIGIAAQRIAEQFHRPTLVISTENGAAHGSGRSIRGFHLLEALTRSRPLFDRVGGHAQAAGFSLPAASIQQLEQQFECHARSVLTPADLEPELRIDSAISLDDVSRELLAEIKRIEPFGCGNPSPVFSAEARLASPPRVLKEKHLKLWLAGSKRKFSAIGWGMAGYAAALEGRGRLSLAFSIAENTFDGVTDLQLELKDVRPAD